MYTSYVRFGKYEPFILTIEPIMHDHNEILHGLDEICTLNSTGRKIDYMPVAQ